MKKKVKVVTIDSCPTIDKFPIELYQEAINSLEYPFDWLKNIGFGEIICNVNNLSSSQTKEAVNKILSADVVFSYGNFAGEPNKFLNEVLTEGYNRKAEHILYVDFGHYLKDALSWIDKKVLKYVLENNVFRVFENNTLNRLSVVDFHGIKFDTVDFEKVVQNILITD